MTHNDDERGGGLRLVRETTAPHLMETWMQRRQEALAREEAARMAFSEAGGVCWACRDTGYLRGDRETGGFCEACDTGCSAAVYWRMTWVADQLRLAATPRLMREWTFATFPTKHHAASLRMARAFVQRWDVNSGRGVLLTGDSSVGKSGLLVAMFEHVLERWSEALADPRAERPPRARGWFTTDESLLDALRASYANGTAHETLKRAKECDLLIIDDLGKADYREGHGWPAERLYAIVNARYSELRPTWFSTNLGAEQLIERLGEMGEPIMERVMDSCEALALKGARLRGGKVTA